MTILSTFTRTSSSPILRPRNIGRRQLCNLSGSNNFNRTSSNHQLVLSTIGNFSTASWTVGASAATVGNRHIRYRLDSGSGSEKSYRSTSLYTIAANTISIGTSQSLRFPGYTSSYSTMAAPEFDYEALPTLVVDQEPYITSTTTTFSATGASNPYENALGEGPYYSNGVFRWVDILGEKVYSVKVPLNTSTTATDAERASVKELDIGVSVGVTAELEQDESSTAAAEDQPYLLATKLGVAKVDPKTSAVEYLAKYFPDDEKLAQRMRANDGKVDSQGRFWVGVMDDFHIDPPTADGVLFRLDNDLTLNTVLTGLTIPNGIGWSLDNTIMYFIDSPTLTVTAFDFDELSGAISNPRPLWKVPPIPGAPDAIPDGLIVDSEGHIWVAIHNAGWIVRLTPAGVPEGRLVLKGSRKLTSMAFGHAGELFITTAGVGRLQEEAGRERDGGVFRVMTVERGGPQWKFKLGVEGISRG